MNLLINKERPADQKCYVLYFILDDQWFNLTAHDMKTALVNAGLEYHGSQATPGTSMSNFTSPPSPASMRSPIHLELTPHKKDIKSDDPPQNMDISHLSDPTSTMNERCPLDTSCDHLLYLDSPSLSSEQQDNSSADSVEIEFLPESEGQQDHINLSPTEVFSGHHDYELFLLQKEIDALNDILNQQCTHIFENQGDILIHATILSPTFALPQFMTQHNCEDLKPTDTPSTVPSAFQASSNHTFNPKCDHNPLATHCNQCQYPNLNQNFHYPN